MVIYMWDCGEVLEKLERCDIGRKTIALEILYLQVKRYTWRDRIFFWQREKATPTSKCPVLSAGMHNQHSLLAGDPPAHSTIAILGRAPQLSLIKRTHIPPS